MDNGRIILPRRLDANCNKYREEYYDIRSVRIKTCAILVAAQHSKYHRGNYFFVNI